MFMARLRYQTSCMFLCFGISVSCAAQVSSSEGPAKALFDFHNGFWINLHHFLYREATVSVPQNGPRPVALNKIDADELKELSPEEHTAWGAAVAYYADSLIQRDLLFDEGMRTVKNQLEDAEASVDLAGAQVPADIKAALLKAAPVYRKHWWARHEAENRQWIAQLQPLIEKYGPSICGSLVKIYDAPWPEYPVRVDTVAYAHWAGAYTTVEPTRPTISTTGLANQGTAALEIVFHETSHGMMDKVTEAIDTAEKAAIARNSNGPVRFRKDIWHQVLFYTAGELVAEQIPGYIPYADKNGLWARAWSGRDRSLIEQDWRPHMNGKGPLSVALAKLVDDLAAASSH
jgi:hypothetical protein